MPSNQFTTARLSVHSWRPVIEDKKARQTLEAALPAILTNRVLEHLPPPLQLDNQDGGMSSWVDARAEESVVLLVERKSNKELVGLVILASDPDGAEIPTIRIGYLLAETAWGQGIASELVCGLVSALANDKPARLIGGVDKDNPASARVLQKAGFVVEPNLSTPSTEMYVHNIN